MTETTDKTKAVSPLVLDGARAGMRKISINVLNKDAKYTLFTIPIEGIELNEQQLDAFMGPYTFRSWYEQRKDGAWYPNVWWSRRKNADYPIEDEFDCESLTIEVSGEEELEFESEESDEDDDEMRPGARITCVVLKPTAGGITLLSFHMQVRPGIGHANLVLQEHMYRSVLLTLGETSIAAKKGGKQQSLPLGGKGSGTGNSKPAAQGAEVTPQTDLALDTAIGRPPAFESKGGEAIDDELRGRHPEGSGEVMGADAHPDPTNTELSAENGMDADLAADLQRFEDDARRNLEDFTSVSTRGVIDGRSERVKHQDAQRESEGETA